MTSSYAFPAVLRSFRLSTCSPNIALLCQLNSIINKPLESEHAMKFGYRLADEAAFPNLTALKKEDFVVSTTASPKSHFVAKFRFPLRKLWRMSSPSSRMPCFPDLFLLKNSISSSRLSAEFSDDLSPGISNARSPTLIIALIA
ncbi:hypothetical protein ACO22_06138 [Paracoccidioides brasiliensis]|uniref:Uncharacterized protein n=1 Tax=Paracoccidioides brasiliensis TaxID=121759 RepID=A0A1D2J8A4_PARBR|nr:hypothetical protein ACO22_06138 [Paracoccidioides brasiliensis]